MQFRARIVGLVLLAGSMGFAEGGCRTTLSTAGKDAGTTSDEPISYGEVSGTGTSEGVESGSASDAPPGSAAGEDLAGAVEPPSTDGGNADGAANGGAVTGGASGSGVGGAVGNGGAGGVTTSGGVGNGGAGGVTTSGGVGNGGAGGGAPGTGGSGGSIIPLTRFFGNIDTQGSIRSDFSTYWDQLTPENVGKWGAVQPTSGDTFNWSPLDAIYRYCTDNHIIFKEQSFIWGSSTATWINSSNAESAAKNWMSSFCQRYPDVKMIDVVNEPLHAAPSYRNGMGGTGSSGYDWIVNAFRWAREACPNAILILNDYNIIEYSNENGAILKLVKAVTEAGGPIMAVGAESHDVAKVSVKTIKAYADKIIAETGLPLYITEMDIGVADDAQQEQIMRDVVTVLWNTERVQGFTYWGYIVGTTWRSNTGLMTDEGTMRPAMTWLMSFLGR